MFGKFIDLQEHSSRKWGRENLILKYTRAQKIVKNVIHDFEYSILIKKMHWKKELKTSETEMPRERNFLEYCLLDFVELLVTKTSFFPWISGKELIFQTKKMETEEENQN